MGIKLTNLVQWLAVLNSVLNTCLTFFAVKVDKITGVILITLFWTFFPRKGNFAIWNSHYNLYLKFHISTDIFWQGVICWNFISTVCVTIWVWMLLLEHMYVTTCMFLYNSWYGYSIFRTRTGANALTSNH